MINIYWWSRVRENNEEFENFGDALVPYILEKTTPQNFKWIIPNENRVLRIFWKKRHYIIIGSILRRATAHSVIWGAGIMFRDSFVPNAKFLAVRGPLTRNRLLELGYKVPARYGDPGLLVGLFNRPNLIKKFKIGFIPHFLDYKEVVDTLGENSKIKIIDFLTNDPQQVIDEINDCELILSSSLHGIIIPHSLGIPSLWIKVSDRLIDDIKFYDYYASLKIDSVKPLPFKKYTLEDIDLLFDRYSKWTLPSSDNFENVLKDLFETFPFKKSANFERAISKYFGERKYDKK